MNQTSYSFETEFVELYQDPTINNFIFNVQPTQRVALRVFPHEPSLKKVCNILRIFFSNTLNLLILNTINSAFCLSEQNSTRREEVKESFTPIRITLKLVAKLQI